MVGLSSANIGFNSTIFQIYFDVYSFYVTSASPLLSILFSETYYVRKHPQWILSSGILRVKSVFACDSSVVRSYRLPVKVLWQKWNGWFWVAQVARDYRKKSRLRKCERLWELVFFMFVSFTSIQQIMAILLKMNIFLNSYYWMTFFNNTHSLPIKVCQVVV